MTNQERYEFVGYAKALFAQSKWTPDQWEAFSDALMPYSADVARQAVKAHFQTTRFTTPTTGAVVNEAKAMRFGPDKLNPEPFSKSRTPDDVVGEFRWTWQAAVRMYGVKDAVRQFASSDATRHVPELLKLGWTADQIDVVIQEITGGEVADSFRDHQRRLRETWDDRVGVVVNKAGRRASSRPLIAALQGAVRGDAVAPEQVESSGDRADGGVQQAGLGDGGDRPIASGADETSGEVVDPDDNDLPAGTYEPIGEDDIPF